MNMKSYLTLESVDIVRKIFLHIKISGIFRRIITKLFIERYLRYLSDIQEPDVCQ